MQCAIPAPLGDTAALIKQLLGNTPNALFSQLPAYMDVNTGQYSLQRFRALQCTYSVGLDVPIPHVLVDDITFGIGEVMRLLEDCMCFDARIDEI